MKCYVFLLVVYRVILNLKLGNQIEFAGEEVKSGEKKEEAQAPAPATEETKTEEQTTVKSD